VASAVTRTNEEDDSGSAIRRLRWRVSLTTRPDTALPHALTWNLTHAGALIFQCLPGGKRNWRRDLRNGPKTVKSGLFLCPGTAANS
jgi:hypothetical protein